MTRPVQFDRPLQFDIPRGIREKCELALQIFQPVILRGDSHDLAHLE